MRTLAILSILLAVGVAAAQQTSPPVPAYNKAGEQVFRGTIQEIKEYRCPISGSIGTHLTVKAELSSVEVHLAPATFLKNYGISLKPGDRVEVVGTKLTFDGKPAMIARSVTVAQDTWIFRDERGRPLW